MTMEGLSRSFTATGVMPSLLRIEWSTIVIFPVIVLNRVMFPLSLPRTKKSNMDIIQPTQDIATTTMTSYAATPPLSMSLCIGDVSFHLSPSDSATSALPIVRRNIDNAGNNDDGTGEGGYCIDLCSFTGTLHVNILARGNILSKNSLVKRSQSNKNVTTDKFDDGFILDPETAVLAPPPPPHMTSWTTEELYPTSPPAIDSSSIAYSATLQKFGGNSSSPFRRVSSVSLGIIGGTMGSSNNNGVVNDNIITSSDNMNGGVNPLTTTVVNHDSSNSDKVVRFSSPSHPEDADDADDEETKNDTAPMMITPIEKSLLPPLPLPSTAAFVRDSSSSNIGVIQQQQAQQSQSQSPQQQPRKPSKRLSPPRIKLKAIATQVLLAGRDVVDALSGETSSLLQSSSNNIMSSMTTSRQRRGSSRKGGSIRQVDDNDSSDDYDDNDDSVRDSDNGTELHKACASCLDSSCDVLKAMLLRHDDSLQEDIHKTDRRGRLPIHILAMNQRLISQDPDGCEELILKLVDLMKPEVVVQALHPRCGLAPFVYILGLWTERLHSIGSSVDANNCNKPPALLSSSTVPVAVAATQSSSSDEENPIIPTTPATPETTSSQQQQTPPRGRSPIRNVPYRSLFSTLSVNESSSSSSSTTKAAMLRYLPASVTISDHEIFAIRILSRFIDNYPDKTREAILTNITSVPLFLKSLLLINDVEMMTELTNTTLVKHVVMDKRSINSWLCAMLTDDTDDVKNRAAIFIKLLSKLTFQDLASSSQSPNRYSEHEIERFATMRKDTFNAIYCWPGFVPAVLDLGDKTIENLSSTRLMRYITDRCILKETSFFYLALDFFLSMFILMGYRLNIELLLKDNPISNIDDVEQMTMSIYSTEKVYIYYSTSGVAIYFLLKEFMTLLSLFLTSTKLAKRYCLSVFNIINVASVVMLIGTGSALLGDPTFFDNLGISASVTMILLWLKLMGAFRILNSAFSLFIYAVYEVMKEVKWFLIFLFLITFMFSDAVRAVAAARGQCHADTISDGIDPLWQCSDKLFFVIATMYSVIVGDVELNMFDSSGAMEAMFVLFTFFSIIILLNILIAIVCESYEGTKQRSREIFDRARIEYAAQLVARKQFLTPKQQSNFHGAQYVPLLVRQILLLMFQSGYVLAIISAEYGVLGLVIFLALDTDNQYTMIRSLIIGYVCVGVIFNLYVISSALIALFSRYEKRGTMNQNACTKIIRLVVSIFKLAISLFHYILGVDEDKTVDEGVFTITDDSLISGGKKNEKLSSDGSNHRRRSR